ncbi:SDR family NAD(P)-dependent oxidoreductase [Burkholderia diffusa]|uniref:SDR family NAD(P)-dependent oxidoreductase n=1 Tax=Burkholderia diffusa TaxID=488732 RepID=UPI0008422F76|nr:SDR family NAD(P)-dependent oxidoreductase [Burkholderia diffusa]AOI61377.1 short-chain dehydrogenase [Burkholderia diffusa]
MASGNIMLITGVSSGFGRALAQAALAAGHTVVGTVRSEAAKRAFEALSPHAAIGRVLDVTDFARIDGAVAMMKAVVPFMRKRGRGRILNITSMGGHITMPGIAYYCGSKFALEGISETLGKELEPFGIAVTAVAPGSFRTDWAGRSMTRTPRSISDYDALFDPIRQAREAKSGRQPGDPAKAARAMLAVIEADHPPAHLLLGSDALRLVRAKWSALEEEIRTWEAVTVSTDG